MMMTIWGIQKVYFIVVFADCFNANILTFESYFEIDYGVLIFKDGHINKIINSN